MSLAKLAFRTIVVKEYSGSMRCEVRVLYDGAKLIMLDVEMNVIVALSLSLSLWLF